MPGPLNKLIKNNSLTNLYYPLDLGSSRKGHYIMFTACIPQKIQYESKGGTSVATAVSPNSLMSGLDKGLNTVQSVASKVASAYDKAISTVEGAAGGAVSAVSGALSSVDAVGSALSGAASKLSDTTTLAGNFLNNPTATLSDVQNTLTGAASGVTNALSGVTNGASSISISSLTQDIGKFFSSSSALRAGVGSLNSGWQNLLLPPTTKPVAYIQLYMPDTVNVNQQMMYKDYSMTQALGALGVGAEVLAEGASYYDKIKGADGHGGTIKNLATSPAAIEAISKIAGMTGAIKNGDDVARFALNKAGNAVNPQMEVAFTQINFREFQFHFTFTPKSPKEAASVREIIKSFRLHGAPEIDKSGAGRYFIVPSVFNIDYIFNGDYNPNLHHFQPCVLTSIQVDYAQDVGWVAFEDGMPVKTHMVLQFRETEILTKEHIDQGF